MCSSLRRRFLTECAGKETACRFAVSRKFRETYVTERRAARTHNRSSKFLRLSSTSAACGRWQQLFSGLIAHLVLSPNFGMPHNAMLAGP